MQRKETAIEADEFFYGNTKCDVVTYKTIPQDSILNAPVYDDGHGNLLIKIAASLPSISTSPISIFNTKTHNVSQDLSPVTTRHVK